MLHWSKIYLLYFVKTMGYQFILDDIYVRAYYLPEMAVFA